MGLAASNLKTKAFVRLILGAGAIIIIIRLYAGNIIPRPDTASANAPKLIVSSKTSGASRNLLPCAELPGANDTVVIMKTGATELEAKLPVHFETTFQCYPHLLIFSDHEEDYGGYHIIDALEHVTNDVKVSNPDFGLYRRLKKEGRGGLKPEELSGPQVKLSNGWGKPDNPGWKLDKWKFLPIVNRTLFEYPGKDWYIFVETDTYIFWSTALAWLRTLNPTDQHYMGSQMQIGEVVFAHGGSGFIVSQAAMRKVVEQFRVEQRKWEGFTAEHWAGDCVLGRIMRDSGSPLLWAWPIFQGLKPGAIDYAKYDYSKRLWCYPSLSYHHLSPDEIRDIWEFEQEWIAKSDKVVHHRDVYNEYIVPHLSSFGRKERSDWDTISLDLEFPAGSIKECQNMCKDNATCVQYSFRDGKCTTSGTPKLGESKENVRSGWFVDRVKAFGEKMAVCKDELWIEKPKEKEKE